MISVHSKEQNFTSVCTSGYVLLDDDERNDQKHGKQDHWDLPHIKKHILSNRMKAAQFQSEDTLFPRCYRGVGYTKDTRFTHAVLSIERSDDKTGYEHERIENTCKLYQCNNNTKLFQFYLSMRNWHAGTFHLELYLVGKDDTKLMLLDQDFTMKSKPTGEQILSQLPQQPEWLISGLQSGLAGTETDEIQEPARKKAKTSPKTPSPPRTPKSQTTKSPSSKPKSPSSPKLPKSPKPTKSKPIVKNLDNHYDNTPVKLTKLPSSFRTRMAVSFNHMNPVEPFLFDPLQVVFREIPCMDVTN